MMKVWSILAIAYAYGIQVFKHSAFCFIGKREEAAAFWSGVKDAISFLRSEDYKSLPLV